VTLTFWIEIYCRVRWGDLPDIYNGIVK
jgi:hypothetical protein